MQFSHSRIGVFESCKFKYQMQYLHKIKVLPAFEADNALLLGTAIHTGIEKDVKTAIKEYFDNFPVIDDLHINETIKLEYLIPRVKELLPPGEFERAVRTPDFIGFLDLLVPVEEWDGTGADEGGYRGGIVYDLYDFKYSNNVKNYLDSGQLHEYKYFFEKANPGKKIKKLYYVIVPKVQIRQKKTEDLFTFRQRIMTELKKSKIQIIPVEFDYTKVVDFALSMKQVLECKDFIKEPSYLCHWCDYEEFCVKGRDYMLLPPNERRIVGQAIRRRLWIYGVPFSGKTSMLDDAPAPLNLNTDGNIQFVTMPYIPIKDEVKVEGRMTKRTFAWEIFKQTIDELEKKQNDFETVIVDLLEDGFEHCRVYIYDRDGITHESDNSFKYYDVVRTEFLSTMKRLINLDYQNIVLISHEDTTKDITKKSGDRITAIKPNITEKVANKIAGMVDIVARVVVEDDGKRTLQFKSNEVIFGGGRLKGIKATTIPLSWEALMQVYDETNAAAKEGSSRTAPVKQPSSPGTESGEGVDKDSFREPAETGTGTVANDDGATSDGTEPNSSPNSEESTGTETPAEPDKPVRKTRKKRGE